MSDFDQVKSALNLQEVITGQSGLKMARTHLEKCPVLRWARLLFDPQIGAIPRHVEMPPVRSKRRCLYFPRGVPRTGQGRGPEDGGGAGRGQAGSQEKERAAPDGSGQNPPGPRLITTIRTCWRMAAGNTWLTGGGHLPETLPARESGTFGRASQGSSAVRRVRGKGYPRERPGEKAGDRGHGQGFWIFSAGGWWFSLISAPVGCCISPRRIHGMCRRRKS